MALIIVVGWLHSMGHSQRCQLEHGALYRHGTARTIGEQMEPMWQKLSPMIPSLRRMTADRRKDAFSIALQQLNDEQEKGLPALLLQKIQLADSKKAALGKATRSLLLSAAGFLTTPDAPCTLELARVLLVEWADDLTTIQTQYADELEPADWKSDWSIKRVQLGHVQFLGDGEATLSLLFSNGGNPLEDSIQKLRDDVVDLELRHAEALREAGWEHLSTSELRASASFGDAFELGRSSLLKSYERRAAQLVCQIASIDETLKRRCKKSTCISYKGLRNKRNKHLRSLSHVLELRQWWASFTLALNAPAESWKNGLEQLFEGTWGPGDSYLIDCLIASTPRIRLTVD